MRPMLTRITGPSSPSAATSWRSVDSAAAAPPSLRRATTCRGCASHRGDGLAGRKGASPSWRSSCSAPPSAARGTCSTSRGAVSTDATGEASAGASTTRGSGEVRPVTTCAAGAERGIRGARRSTTVAVGAATDTPSSARPSEATTCRSTPSNGTASGRRSERTAGGTLGDSDGDDASTRGSSREKTPPPESGGSTAPGSGDPSPARTNVERRGPRADADASGTAAPSARTAALDEGTSQALGGASTTGAKRGGRSGEIVDGAPSERAASRERKSLIVRSVRGRPGGARGRG